MEVNANVKDEGETSTSTAEGQPEMEESAVDLQNPWPYLAPLFKLLSVVGNTFRFKCLLCLPKKVECSAYRNSPSNLKKHVERVHLARMSMNMRGWSSGHGSARQ